MQVIPGILEREWSEIDKKLKIIKTFTNTVHIDIIDGKFTDNKTFLSPEPFKEYSESLFLEAHLMVEDPESYIEKYAAAGFKRFIGHIEHMHSQSDFVKRAAEHGETALALDGPTHISAIKVPFEKLNSLLVYTSHKVGHSGPPLLEERLDKIMHLRKLTNIPIEADGGINNKTIAKAKEAGATRFVSTGFIWNSENPANQYKKLLDLIS